MHPPGGHSRPAADPGDQTEHNGGPTMHDLNTHQLLSVSDAADLLAVSTKTIRRYIAAGQLEAVRFGGKTLRVKMASIERLIRAGSFGGRAAATVTTSTTWRPWTNGR